MSSGKKFFKTAVPFFVLVLGGAIGLVQFSEIRYKYRKQQEMITPENAEKLGIKMKKPSEVTIEKEFEKMQKLDLDTWENKRGPRPWEQDNPTMKEINERATAAKARAS